MCATAAPIGLAGFYPAMLSSSWAADTVPPTFERLPLLEWFGPVAEIIGTVLPSFGAVQVLTVRRTDAN
jgi:hypothetical protein